MIEGSHFADFGGAYTRMLKNQHATGNMALLVNSPRAGLRMVENVIEAGQGR